MDKFKLNEFLDDAILAMHEPIEGYTGNPYQLTMVYKARLKKIVLDAYAWGKREGEGERTIKSIKDE